MTGAWTEECAVGEECVDVAAEGVLGISAVEGIDHVHELIGWRGRGISDLERRGNIAHGGWYCTV